jgi:glycosyltransferase involved in cell wall biosynthesis
MTDLPRISIVVPSFRSSATIEETLKSIVGQDYPNKELIVVDGAGDDTARILERYADRIHWWCSEPDGGQYDAIRKGFARAGGEVFFWLNADDKLLPGALDVVGEIFGQHEDVRWLSSLAPGHYDAKGYYSGHGGIAGFSREAFLDGYNLPGVAPRGQWIQQESTFFHASLWKDVEAPFEGYDLAGDFALWCEFYKRADLVGVTYPLAGFRHIAGQRSEDISEYKRQGRRALEELRRHEGYSVSPMRRLRFAQVARLPRIGGIAARRFGYVGRKIVRSRARHPDASWESVEHRWLPR